ncbi:TPA: FRG domain-containing protein, partial [Legionella pneumophila subsp. pneumophila]|nr:FRG domain-containing protein [Legionella pneumophila subsp. pneumophila]
SKSESWDTFLQTINTLNQNENWIFRGQNDGSWDLKPSLLRLCCNPNEQEFQEMLNLFKNTLIEMGLKKYRRVDNTQQWCIARHYGLPSPALDWSYDPRVALFFAIENFQTTTNKTRYVPIYIFDKSIIEKKFKELINLYDDQDLDKRISAQKGLLMFIKNNQQIESILEEPNLSYKYFRKVYIGREDTKKCLNNLEKNNNPICKKTLYPESIEGAVQYCNFKFQKYFRQSYKNTTLMTIKNIEPPLFNTIEKDKYKHFVLLNSRGLPVNCVKCDKRYDNEQLSLEAFINHYLLHGMQIIGLREE